MSVVNMGGKGEQGDELEKMTIRLGRDGRDPRGKGQSGNVQPLGPTDGGGDVQGGGERVRKRRGRDRAEIERPV